MGRTRSGSVSSRVVASVVLSVFVVVALLVAYHLPLSNVREGSFVCYSTSDRDTSVRHYSLLRGESHEFRQSFPDLGALVTNEIEAVPDCNGYRVRGQLFIL